MRYVATEGLAPCVFRGRAVGAERDVAIVRIPPAWTARGTTSDLVLAELRAAMLPSHPHVVELFDIGRAGDHYYVVGEYIAGCSLARVSSPLAVPHAVHIALACCDGLAHAHASAMLHRRVNPRAIVLARDGRVKLGGFGLMRLRGRGRLGYTSPEACERGEIDQRADVFAAGVVLWEMLAGRPLFAGHSDYATVELVRAAHISPLPDIDPDLDAICRTALARDPERRFRTARAFADALRRFVVDRPLQLPGVAALVDETLRRGPPGARPAALDVQDDIARMISIVNQN